MRIARAWAGTPSISSVKRIGYVFREGREARKTRQERSWRKFEETSWLRVRLEGGKGENNRHPRCVSSCYPMEEANVIAWVRRVDGTTDSILIFTKVFANRINFRFGNLSFLSFSKNTLSTIFSSNIIIINTLTFTCEKLFQFTIVLRRKSSLRHSTDSITLQRNSRIPPLFEKNTLELLQQITRKTSCP